MTKEMNDMTKEMKDMTEVEKGLFVGKSQAICLIAEDQMKINWHWAAEDLWSTLYGLLKEYGPKDKFASVQSMRHVDTLDHMFREVLRTWMNVTSGNEGKNIEVDE